MNHVIKKTVFAEFSSEVLSRVKVEQDGWKINADGLYYRELNSLLRTINSINVRKIKIQNVYGQRYLGTDLDGGLEIHIYGVPGNDLGAFMNGPRLLVHGNAQDGSGNTMNEGSIIIHGHAGDITGYSMRGGKIFVRDNVGYRVGIHMKEYKDKKPYIVIGGTAQDFLGEYMAGGVLVVLGLNLNEEGYHKTRFIGTGMHGGVMYIRGEVSHLGREVEAVDINQEDINVLQNLVGEFCNYFRVSFDESLYDQFNKIIPVSHRPYGRLYAY